MSSFARVPKKKFTITRSSYHESCSGLGGDTDTRTVLATDDVDEFLKTAAAEAASVKANNGRWAADFASLKMSAVEYYQCQVCEWTADIRIVDCRDAQEIIDAVKMHESIKAQHNHETYLRDRIAHFTVLLANLRK